MKNKRANKMMNTFEVSIANAKIMVDRISKKEDLEEDEKLALIMMYGLIADSTNFLAYCRKRFPNF